MVQRLMVMRDVMRKKREATKKEKLMEKKKRSYALKGAAEKRAK